MVEPTSSGTAATVAVADPGETEPDAQHTSGWPRVPARSHIDHHRS
jgi:hypothetical protein